VRTPHKTILTIPPSKPHLAHAIALEWDLLTSASQALKNHNIPLTSTTSHADDILNQEAQGNTNPREDIIKTVMRYLDTDTLLCWAPEKSPHDVENTSLPPEMQDRARTGESLRQIQQRTAQPILSYLTTRVWPGAGLHPVLDESSILPKKQPEMTKSIIRGWITGLSAYELAALERGVLASKSLLVATRLLVEWSEEFRDIQNSAGAEGAKRFGIEEAAEACTTEVRWQTAMWGEVEDTHDVEREDLRRQLGSVVLLVSGNKQIENID
jgi:ATP synthase mitochondrial F1 complex assembly factor 2